MTEARQVAEQLIVAYNTAHPHTQLHGRTVLIEKIAAALTTAATESARAQREADGKICQSLVAECDKRSGIGNIKSEKFKTAARTAWVGFGIGAEEAEARIRSTPLVEPPTEGG